MNTALMTTLVEESLPETHEATAAEMRTLMMQKRLLLQEIEASLRDEAKQPAFIEEHGEKVGSQRYQAWRYRAGDKMKYELARYRALKAQVKLLERQDEIAGLLHEVWTTLGTLPEHKGLRDRVWKVIRDRFHTLVLDEKRVRYQ